MKRKTIVDEIKKLNPKVGVEVINQVVASFVSVVGKAIANKETVTIYNFGEWYIKRSKTSHVYDFQNKVVVPFSGRDNVVFRPSPKIRRQANSQELAIKG